MSDAEFQMFQQCFSGGAELLYAVCLTLFFRPFLRKKESRRKSCAIVFFTSLFLSWFFTWIPFWQGTFTLTVIVLLTAESRILGLEKSMTFLLGVLFWNARVCGGLTVGSLYFIADQLLPYSLELPERFYLRSAVLLTFLLFSHAAVLMAMLFAFQRQMKKQRLPLHPSEVCYLSLIPSAGILFGQMIASLLYEVNNGEMLSLYERHPLFLAAVPLLAFLFYAGAWLSLLFRQKMVSLREEQAAGFAKRQQMQGLRAQLQETEQFYSQLRRMKHEMRGHLTNLKGLAQSGEYASLKEYISRIDGDMQELCDYEPVFQTGNPVTDVIVNEKRRQCLELGISFQVDFHYPESGGYDAFDLGMVLQNLLQNAWEACEKQTETKNFISLTGKRKGRFFLIEVKNSFTGEVRFGEDGLPVTDKKEDVSMHGIGLPHVRRITEKYMGEMEIRLADGVFLITVMVQEQ